MAAETLPATDTKILFDLATLTERISLATDMLVMNSGQVDLDASEDDPLLQVLGFLDACKPRMIELITESNSLLESTIEECLKVNDQLMKVLDFDNQDFNAAAATNNNDETLKEIDKEFDDLLLGDTSIDEAVVPVSKPKGKTDPFDGDLLDMTIMPATATSPAASAPLKAKQDESDKDLFAKFD